MQLFAKLKKNSAQGVQSHLKSTTNEVFRWFVQYKTLLRPFIINKLKQVHNLYLLEFEWLSIDDFSFGGWRSSIYDLVTETLVCERCIILCFCEKMSKVKAVCMQTKCPILDGDYPGIYLWHKATRSISSPSEWDASPSQGYPQH